MPSRSEIPVTEARAELSDLVNRVAYTGEQIVLTRHGRPVAALVPLADAERSLTDPAGDGPSPIEHLPAPRVLQDPGMGQGIAARSHGPPTVGHQDPQRL